MTVQLPQAESLPPAQAGAASAQPEASQKPNDLFGVLMASAQQEPEAPPTQQAPTGKNAAPQPKNAPLGGAQKGRVALLSQKLTVLGAQATRQGTSPAKGSLAIPQQKGRLVLTPQQGAQPKQSNATVATQAPAAQTQAATKITKAGAISEVPAQGVQITNVLRGKPSKAASLQELHQKLSNPSAESRQRPNALPLLTSKLVQAQPTGTPTLRVSSEALKDIPLNKGRTTQTASLSNAARNSGRGRRTSVAQAQNLQAALAKPQIDQRNPAPLEHTFKLESLEGLQTALETALTEASLDAEGQTLGNQTGSLDSGSATQSSSARNMTRAGASKRAAQWLRLLNQRTADIQQQNPNWKSLELQLDEADGNVLIKVSREDGGLSVTMGFSESSTMQFVESQAGIMQEALESSYQSDVNLSFQHEGADWRGYQEAFHDAMRRSRRTAAALKNAAPAEAAASTAQTNQIGEKHEWIG